MFEEDALRADVEAALTAQGGPAAMKVLTPHREQLLSHAWFAQLWCIVLAHNPERVSLTEEADAVLARFGSNLDVAVPALAALNAAASLWPPDAPPRETGPEHVAAGRAASILSDVGAHPLRAYVHVNRANALRVVGEDGDAEAQVEFGAALELEPDNGAWHHDLAALHMWRGRWREALDSILRARARLGETRGVVWNLGLIATALGEGDVAAGAWRDLGFEGLKLAKGGLPLIDDLPAALVRVRSKASGHGVVAEPDQRFEVLTVAPHSPGHGVVVTPTFGESPIDYGDLVLWSGAPVARVDASPVFPVLEKLRSGDEARMRFVAIAEAGEVERLISLLPDGAKAFMRGESSTGERLVYGKLVVPSSVALSDLRARFERAASELRTLRFAIPELYEQVGDTRRAGQEHQAWRGVEKAALKRGLVSPTVT